jgi:hypothetical protein
MAKVTGKDAARGTTQAKQIRDVPLKVGERKVDKVNPGYMGVGLGGLVGQEKARTAMLEGREADKTNLGNYEAERCPQGPGGGREVSKTGIQGHH